MDTLDPLSHFDLSILVRFYFLKVFIAVVCGGVVGTERELKQKVAGLKTNILICVGASLYSATAIAIKNPNVISYIVSGIGFLGAGSIFKSENKVVGLTTAAYVWVLASIGIIIGCGGIYIALGLTFALMLMTFLLSKFETWLRRVEREKPIGE